MKKFVLLLSVVSFVLTLISCGEDKQRAAIRQSVEAWNSTCPYNIDQYSTMTAIELNNDTIVYTVVSSEEIVNVSYMSKNDTTIRKLIKINLFRQENKRERNQLVKIADCGLWIKWIYLGQKTNERYAMLLSPEEISSGLDSPMSQKEMNDVMLQMMLEMEKNQGSSEIGKGMVLKESRLNDNAVVYLIEVDEQYYDIGMFKGVAPETKKEISHFLSSQKSLISAMINTNRELIYKYVGNRSGKSFPLVFSVSDLEKIIE